MCHWDLYNAGCRGELRHLKQQTTTPDYNRHDWGVGWWWWCCRAVSSANGSYCEVLIGDQCRCCWRWARCSGCGGVGWCCSISITLMDLPLTTHCAVSFLVNFLFWLRWVEYHWGAFSPYRSRFIVRQNRNIGPSTITGQAAMYVRCWHVLVLFVSYFQWFHVSSIYEA